MIENNLFKGFTTKGVRNNQKYSGKLHFGVAWNSSCWGRFLAGSLAAPPTVAVKLAGLLSSDKDTKAVRHFEEINYTQNATKSISLFNAYECLNLTFPFAVHFLLVTRSRCFRFWILNLS